jgi:hypothetical protein
MTKPFSPLPASWSPFFVLLACLVLVALPMAPAALADSADADSTAKADLQLQENGWTVDSITLIGANAPGVRHLEASGRIAAPSDSVWAVISRPDDEGDHWPSLKDVVVEKATTDTVIARYTMAIPVYPDRHYRLRSVADHKRKRFNFEMLPGYGNVHEIKGYWLVTSLGDSLSRVIYVLDTDPGARLIPGFLIDWATRKTIPRSFAFIKEQTQSHDRSSAESDETVR